MEKRQRKTWSAVQENILIHLWGKHINALRSCRRNSHIFMEMAAEMEGKGQKFSDAEIKIKIHNLTNKYRTEKNKIGPSEWKLFSKVHQILGKYKTNNIGELMEEGKSKRTTSSSAYQAKVADILEENSERLRDEFKYSHEFENKILKLAEKSLEIVQKTADTLQTIAENNSRFHKEILEILRNQYLLD